MHFDTFKISDFERFFKNFFKFERFLLPRSLKNLSTKLTIQNLAIFILVTPRSFGPVTSSYYITDFNSFLSILLIVHISRSDLQGLIHITCERKGKLIYTRIFWPHESVLEHFYIMMKNVIIKMQKSSNFGTWSSNIPFIWFFGSKPTSIPTFWSDFFINSEILGYATHCRFEFGVSRVRAPKTVDAIRKSPKLPSRYFSRRRRCLGNFEI